MKIYDLVKSIMERYPVTRNDDKKLIWVVLGELGYIHNGTIAKEDFLRKRPSLESITRARRKIQEEFSELDSNDNVKAYRKELERQKGTHIYRETVNTRENLINDLVDM